MKKTAILLLTLSVIGLFSNNAYAQQDAQYTQYMYNTLSINPAYAGSRDVLSILGLYRTQWVGLDGSPETATFSLHSPVSDHVGLGLNVTRDEIFISDETYIDGNFSYSFNVSERGKLALGLKAGAHLLNIDSSKAITGPYDIGDSDSEFFVDNKFSPQFGLGAFYYTQNYYLGLSAPSILETEHYDTSSNSNSSTAKENAHLYLMTGYTFQMGSDLKFKPAGLVKVVEGAPLQVDISANMLMKEKFTLGLAYRWSAALSAMAGFQISDQLMLGFAYDAETTELAQYNDGSFEFFLRYEFFKRDNRLISPRFF
ncbi:hypothetical protein SCB49_08108 [unidentified eubacterium SCB49]|nr:hypothetical protein SCB49_08108 [unidentified eubacterium SCB49]